MSVIWSPASTKLNSIELEMLNHPHTSGLIFFAYNYESPEQMKELISSALEVNPNIIISVDQEGGRVQRFVDGMSKLPAASKLGEIYQQDKTRGLEVAYSMGRLCGSELAELGINLNYAPVLDIDIGISKVIGSRSYGQDASVVIAVAEAYISGMEDAGVIAVGKHFPGHGGVADDTHHNLPQDKRDVSKIFADAEPFIQLSAKPSPKLKCIMTSHILFPAVDAKAVTFSEKWLQQKLRQEMGFQGFIFSDDLSMGAAKELYDDSAVATLAMLQAGGDFALVCNDVDATMTSLNKLEEVSYPLAADKVNDLLQNKTSGAPNSSAKWDPEEARHLCKSLN